MERFFVGANERVSISPIFTFPFLDSVKSFFHLLDKPRFEKENAVTHDITSHD